MSLASRVRDALTPSRVVVLAVLVLLLVFVLENTGRITIRLIVPEVSAPLWLTLVAMLVIGWFLGRFVHVRRRS
ncbi:DUF1049 domain-containing protein [Streptomyces morookaense]|uniref:DUF1049 domain-containing protein n=1 Tax=Streptomyces morookaense TaxID=1970 RepID=A0A7Y7E5H2_STRMO|nr:DUF1049 domain-containing protein [Streptomyces morookaense]NVK76157.1 DUF1049 domain-containing protein [Streptomyces morookaense]GHF37748.1 hypothetical protein GCM10010359_45580 [Streptomyces morookaense]